MQVPTFLKVENLVRKVEESVEDEIGVKPHFFHEILEKWREFQLSFKEK